LSSRASDILRRLDIEGGGTLPGIYTGSGWKKGSGKVLTSREAATGEVLAHVSSASKHETAEALEDCKKAFLEWRVVPAPKRGQILRQIRDRLSLKLDDLGALVSLEMGKSE